MEMALFTKFSLLEGGHLQGLYTTVFYIKVKISYNSILAMLYVYGGYDPIIGILTDLWKINLDNLVGEWENVHVGNLEEAPKTFRNSGGRIENRFYIFGGKLNASTSSSKISCLHLDKNGFYWRNVTLK